MKLPNFAEICKVNEFNTFVSKCVQVVSLMYKHKINELKECNYLEFEPLIQKWASTYLGECFGKSKSAVDCEHSVSK